MDRYALFNRRTQSYVRGYSGFARSKSVQGARIYYTRSQRSIKSVSWWDSSEEDWVWVKVSVSTVETL